MLVGMFARLALPWIGVACFVAPGRAEHLGEWERTLTGLAEPVDAAFVGDELWILERRGARIVVLDEDGSRKRAFGGASEGDGGLHRPSSFAVGSSHVYVADTGHDRIRTFTLDGRPDRSFGSPGSGPGELRTPHGVALAGERVLVADTDNHRVQVFSLAGAFLASFGERGSDPGSFDSPVAIAANRRGEIYVAGRRNHRIQRFRDDGRFLTTWGTRGLLPGLFVGPAALEWAGGRLFAADALGARVQVFDLHGNALYLFGDAPSRAGEHEGALHEPAGIAVDEALSRAAVCEPLEGRVQLFTAERGGDDHEPHAVGHDPLPAYGPGGSLAGTTLALVDRNEAAVAVFDVSKVGLVRLGQIGGYGRGLGRFVDPFDVAVDEDGTILVSDPGQRRVTRFRLNDDFPPTDPRVATTVRSRSFEDGRLALLDGLPFEPGALALDGERRIWIADRRTRGLVRLSPRLGVEEALVTELERRARFVDLAWHPSERRLYAALADRPGLVTLGSGGAIESELAPERSFRPRSVAVAESGDVVVADAQRQRIVVFREGEVAAELGERGWDAGAFAGLDAVFPCVDRLYVLDRRQRRGQILTSEGRFLMAFGHGH